MLSVVISPFSFLTWSLLSLILGDPSQRFVSFVHPFKEPALGFIDLFFLLPF